MASLEIATKANAALVLPSLLLANYLEYNALLSPVSKCFSKGEILVDKKLIRLTLTDGRSFTDISVVKCLSELAIAGDTPRRAIEIQQWIRRSEDFTQTDFQSLRRPLEELDKSLTLRTHLVGYSLSVADLALWGTLRGNKIIVASMKKKPNNVSRWYDYIENSVPWISDAVSELTNHASKERAAMSAAGASFEIDLPNISGPIVTRFPPEPSGYLHIGHAKAALLNDYFAHRNSGGTLICRFDDTNPSKEKMEFQDSIMEDLKAMGIITEKTTFSSDYFQEMYEYALQLINSGKAFADDSELGKGDEDRKNRMPSKRREMGSEETLEHFAEMKTGSEEGQRWCIRARIAYGSPNGTLRDPVIYRCNMTPHHRTGTRWKIYPTYDFCAPILDSVEGVTLALRTNEYRDRNVQYEWMQDALGLRKVTIWDFSRLSFVRTVLSKRKLTRIVDDGKVWGWDDPRMPTIRGILRRGMTVSALREFILKQGPSRNILNLEWGALWAMNKRDIDPIVPRHTAIVQDNAVYCVVRGIEAQEEIMKPKYIKNLELGLKKVIYDKTIILEQVDAQSFAQGEEITLMNWGNANVRNITKDSGEKFVTGLELELHLSGDVKKTKKISWLTATKRNLVPVDLVAFDHLITKDKLEKDDELETFLAKDTEFRTQAFADCNVTELPRGSIIQFERKGYYKLDSLYKVDGSRMVFFDIPTGKS